MEFRIVLKSLTDQSMVMDNDDAQKRQGVQPTYKKKEGFHPLQIIWNGKIVDAIFRGGSKNGNFGNTVVNMVTDLANLIRSEYSETVTIILRCDSGFFDEKNFAAFDELNIGFIARGKMYDAVKQQAGDAADELSHRGLKDFGFEQLPFKRFGQNSAFYYCMLK